MAWLKLSIAKNDSVVVVNSDHIIRFSAYDQENSRIHLTEVDKDQSGETIIVKKSVDELVAMLASAGEEIVDPSS